MIDNKWVMPDAYSRLYKTKEQLCSLFLSTVCIFFNIHITAKELEFLSFILSNGSSFIGNEEKKAYRLKYETSKEGVDNMVSSLKKKLVIVKKGGSIKIHDKLGIKMTGDNYIFQFRCRKQEEKN